MVVDGEATQLKWSTMDQREKVAHGRGGACYHRNRRTGRRTQLNSKINEVYSRERERETQCKRDVETFKILIILRRRVKSMTEMPMIINKFRVIVIEMCV